MKTFKKIGKVFLIILIAVFVLVGGFTTYHHIALSVESKSLKPVGQMVTVKGHKMSVYADGEGNNKPSLVFLSGAGTVSPIYSFKPLYTLLAAENRIVIVERFGYGYSDITNSVRDIDSILEDTRESLKQAGEQSPYILMPHSMGGLEALYWAKKYPTEVAGIIGLDMASPQSYLNPDFDFKAEKSKIDTAKFLKFFGLSRILGGEAKKGLTKKEISQQNMLKHRNFVNVSIYKEGLELLNNAEKVKTKGYPIQPMLMFISNGKDIGKFWIPTSIEFAETVGSEIVHLNCGHYVFQYKQNEIAEKIKDFINKNF